MFRYGDNVGASDFSNKDLPIVGSIKINVVRAYPNISSRIIRGNGSDVPTPAVRQAFKFLALAIRSAVM